MEEKIEQVIVEATTDAMQDFMEVAVNEAVMNTIQDTGYITLEEAETIKAFAYKVITEASEDFVPELELEENATEAGEAGEADEAGEAAEVGEAAEENGEQAVEENGEAGEENGEAGEQNLEESTSLADAIAKKLEIM